MIVHKRSAASARDWRPFVLRTSGSATHGIYGLILATAVISVSRELDSSDAGRAALSVLVTALVFWLAHVYAYLLGEAVSQDGGCSRAAVVEAMRKHWSLVEVAIPLVLVLALGAIGVIPDRTALGVSTALALVELTATGAYAAIRHGASRAGALASAMIALALGASIVLLKVLIH
jgi:hypothetical protein